MDKKLIRDICICTNNCANCFNDETKEVDCYPEISLDFEEYGKYIIINDFSDKIYQELIIIGYEYRYITIRLRGKIVFIPVK